MNFKEASGKACEIWLKLGLHGNFSNSNMDRSSCHVWKVAISFSNLNFSNLELVTTNYQALQAWMGLNVTRYHSLNALPHVLPHALSFIFSEICQVLSYLQRVTTRYRYYFFNKILIIYL